MCCVLARFPMRMICTFFCSRAEQEIKYDKAVLATGSYPFVPPTPGVDKKGVFVYRTIDDLEVSFLWVLLFGGKYVNSAWMWVRKHGRQRCARTARLVDPSEMWVLWPDEKVR